MQAGDLREWSRQQLDRGAWAAEWEQPQEDPAWARAGPARGGGAKGQGQGQGQGQPEGGPEAGRLFDKVLLDAPCTGERGAVC